MQPYYDDGTVTIYHGDCREILPAITADLLLSDPPYGIGYKGGAGGNLIHTSCHRKQEAVAGDAEPFDPVPLLLQCPNIALFGGQHYANRLPDGGTFHVWDKRGDYKPVHTADFDTIWINRKEPGRIVRCVWRGICREVEHDQAILHPTQKPLRVVSWVLDLFPGTRNVLDPYMGSGTTLRVAKDRGLRAIGIEIDERYCEIAARRMGQEVFDLAA